jgi:4-amino-4-deoxy-L-arabinose transferase-like glycosyltransferase
MARHIQARGDVKYSQHMPKDPRLVIAWLAGSLLLIWGVGMFGRGYWTPDEPREADIAWRMSWQADRAVPLLAGEAFCEKPPLTYWLAALPIKILGAQAWVARLPNLLYALITALSVGLLAARSAGRFAGLVGAAVIGTFLLSYQVAIWLASDALLLACVSVALLGTYIGFYAQSSRERLCGYSLMHIALGLGFLCKSAAAWMVPALTLVTLIIWEKRWRELFRWEFYVGALIQAAMILTWVWFVYAGVDGPAHLKVFFWNNLVGRFATVEAPPELQYASAHRNTPGKYLIELPVYLFPWTLLVIAAGRRAWRQRRTSAHDNRTVRFALAAALPCLIVLSLAATARNIYLAPALPGVALLVAWWAREILPGADRWDVRALRATAVMLLAGVVVFAVALTIIGATGWGAIANPILFILVSLAGLVGAAVMACRAWSAARHQVVHAQWFLLLAYCALLVGPASQLYTQVDTWQDLAKIGRAVERDAAGHPLILLAPDETTRAMIDMYARSSVERVATPLYATVAPNSLILTQLPGRAGPLNTWLQRAPSSAVPNSLPQIPAARLEVAQQYSLPNGRRYALLRVVPAQ